MGAGWKDTHPSEQSGAAQCGKCIRLLNQGRWKSISFVDSNKLSRGLCKFSKSCYNFVFNFLLFCFSCVWAVNSDENVALLFPSDLCADNRQSTLDFTIALGHAMYYTFIYASTLYFVCLVAKWRLESWT